MQVTETLSDGLKRGRTVVLPSADLEGRRAAKLSELGRTLRLPGFRPGKIPPSVVRQRYGTAVNAEVLEESVSEATRQVLSDRGLRAASQPKIDLAGDPAAAADLEFKVEVELLPEIALPEFGGISLTRLKAAPDEATLDRALGELAQRQSELVDVQEARGAETGDTLVVDFLGKLDGEPFAGGAGTDTPVELGGQGFIPGFADQLVGLAPGEARTIDVTFPAEYHAAELAGKAAQFAITAKKLQRRQVPAVDEALAEKLGFEGLSEVRDAIRSQAQREYDQLSRLSIKRELLDALAALADFPAPEGMVEAEFGQIWARVESERKAGRGDSEDEGKDEATLRAEYRAIAERRVRLGLMLAEIGRAHGITVTQEELSRAMRNEARRYPGQEAQVMEFFRKQPQAVDQLRGPIFEDKVVDFVLELAKVEERQVTPEALAAGPDGPAAPAAAEKPEGAPDDAGRPCRRRKDRARTAERARASGVAGTRRTRPHLGGRRAVAGALRDRNDEHVGSRPRRGLRQRAGADGGGADRPRRARLRHLLAPAQGADHLPDGAGL